MTVIDEAHTADTAGTATRGPFAGVVESLVGEFADVIPSDVVATCVADEATRIADVRIKTFVEILVHKAARDRLRSLSRGRPPSEPAPVTRSNGR